MTGPAGLLFGVEGADFEGGADVDAEWEPLEDCETGVLPDGEVGTLGDVEEFADPVADARVVAADAGDPPVVVGLSSAAVAALVPDPLSVHKTVHVATSATATAAVPITAAGCEKVR